MQELKYLKNEGEYAVLEAEDGTTFRILLEDLNRKTIKSTSTSNNDGALSPREIQLEIRAGMGVAELAAKTGASLEYIEKFAAPVIDELAHVVQSALSTRITVAGDKYSETIQVEFGEVIASRLAANGYANAVWSSRKVDNNSWQISCTVEGASAVWSFDPKKLAISPDNELAVSLSTQQTFTDGPIPKLRSVINTSSSGNTASATETSGMSAGVRTSPPSAFAPAEPVAQEAELDSTESQPVSENSDADNSGSITRDLGSTLEFDGVIPFGRQKPGSPEEPTMGEDLANTADLLEALRKKRQEREATAAAEHPFQPTTEAIEVVADDAVSDESSATSVAEVADETTDIDALPEATTTAENTADLNATQPTAVKKGRTSVPKWDEIVFGSPKGED